MKARKLSLVPYDMEVPGQPGTSMPYDVKKSIANVLMHPARHLTGSGLMKAHALADKCMKGDSVLLTEDEYQELKGTIETLEGFTINDVPFVRRVFEDTPIVDLTEKENR